MSRVISWVLAGWTVAIGLLAAGAAVAAPRVVLALHQPVELPEGAGATDLVADVSDALRKAGCEIATMCVGPNCWNAHPAFPSVVMSAVFPGGEYSCSGTIELRAAVSGEVKFRQSLDREACPVAFLVRDARQAAASACADVRRTAPAADLIAPPAPPPRMEGPGPRRWLPTTLIAAGVVLAVGGGVLWAVDGQGTDCVDGGPRRGCTSALRTKGAGIPLFAGGILAAGLGLAFITGVF